LLLIRLFRKFVVLRFYSVNPKIPQILIQTINYD